MPDYILNEANSPTKHKESHNSLLSLLINTLMKSEFSSVELFSATEDPVTEPYYRIHRADIPDKFVNVVFVK